MANFLDLDDKKVEVLNKIADMMHPHMAGNNHTRLIVEKVYKKLPMTIDEIFDAGKYYDRMLEYIKKFPEEDHALSAVLDFKHICYSHKNIQGFEKIK